MAALLGCCLIVVACGGSSASNSKANATQRAILVAKAFVARKLGRSARPATVHCRRVESGWYCPWAVGGAHGTVCEPPKPSLAASTSCEGGY